MNSRVREILHVVADRLGTTLHQRDPLVPPMRLVTADGSHDVREFIFVGESIARWLVEVGLNRHDRVLDVGCGVGRVAIPLLKILDRSGSYCGVDIVPEQIQWCVKAIGSRYPNASFALLDAYSARYNPAGKLRAEEIRFPYADADFDLVLLMSVFTHLLPAGSRNYLSEIRRVLRPGKSCAMTWFLLNDDSRARIAASPSSPGPGAIALRFEHQHGECWIENRSIPEAAVGYDQATVEGWCRDCGLQIDRIIYGSWCGRPDAPGYQDVLLVSARRPD